MDLYRAVEPGAPKRKCSLVGRLSNESAAGESMFSRFGTLSVWSVVKSECNQFRAVVRSKCSEFEGWLNQNVAN